MLREIYTMIYDDWVLKGQDELMKTCSWWGGGGGGI